jgi:hypothetical protein
MWERVISFLLIADNQKSAREFCKAMKCEIAKVHCQDKKITTKLRVALTQHLDLCLDLSLAIKIDDNFIGIFPNIWRYSNLIRHHLVVVPLLNYTSYEGDLASYWDKQGQSIDERKIIFSPRYVHFDECLSFVYSGCDAASDEDSISRASKLFEQFHRSEFLDVQSEDVQIKKEDEK